jgi:hypothetical protein
VQEQIRKRAAQTTLESVLAELERELRAEGDESPATAELTSLAAASLERGAPEELAAGLESEDDA